MERTQEEKIADKKAELAEYAAAREAAKKNLKKKDK